MTQYNLLFDLDDTLIHCNKYFDLVVDQFAVYLAKKLEHTGIDIQSIKQKQYDLDIAGVMIHGFTIEHFPQSFVDTYMYYSKTTDFKINKEEMEYLREIAQSVYHIEELEPYPFMTETLQILSEEGHKLHLYTGGVPEIQYKKVNQLGLEAFFGNRIFVAQHKDTNALANILHDQRLYRDRTWMIGNSIRTDIIPALTTGIHAIYIPVDNEWPYNVTPIEVEAKGAFITISSLEQVPEIVRDYSSASSS